MYFKSPKQANLGAALLELHLYDCAIGFAHCASSSVSLRWSFRWSFCFCPTLILLRAF